MEFFPFSLLGNMGRIEPLKYRTGKEAIIIIGWYITTSSMRWVTCTTRKYISHGKGPSWRFRSKMLFDPQKATKLQKAPGPEYELLIRNQNSQQQQMSLYLGKTPFKFIPIFYSISIHFSLPPPTIPCSYFGFGRQPTYELITSKS